MSPRLQRIAARLAEARSQLESAQSRVLEVVSARIGGPDGDYAYRQAIKEETQALRNYVRVMREYRDCIGLAPPSKELDA